MSERVGRPLRVLVVGPAPSGPDSRGGMATVVRMMLEHPDPGFTVSSVATYGDGNLVRRLLVGVRGMALASWYVLCGRVDVLHVHLSHGGSVIRKSLPLLTARAVGVPAVIHGHSYDFAGWFESLPGPAQRAVRAALPATRWLVLGTALAQEYAACMMLPPDEVGVLYNAVRVHPGATAGQDGPGPVRAVALGRLGTRKGSFDLIAAFAGLAPDVRSQLRLTLAGDGAVAEVRRAVREAGLAEVVTLLGWIGPDDRDDLLGRSQIFVLPSYDEGLPMALLEAMARGLVPISTPVGSIAEVITDGVDGLLVTPGDRVALGNALSLLVLDPGRRTQLAAATRERIAAFDVTRWYRELGSVWEAVARAPRRPRDRTTP